MNAVEPLLTVKDVIALTRLSRSKVYELIEAGVLPRVKLAGVNSVRVEPAALRAWLDAGRAPAAKRKPA
jgi:excisionase family DNA binding protein